MTSSVQAGSFSEYFPSDLFSTSLVLLEAAIPAPHTLVQLQNERKKAQEKDDEMMVLVDTAQEQENKEKAESEEERLRRVGGAGSGKKKSATTTLTIVQDFPKKRAAQMEQMSQYNLVQDNSTTLNETVQG